MSEPVSCNGKSQKLDNQRGFTLIELLLVIALVAISIGVTSDILISLVRSYNKTTVLTEIEQEANFVTLKIEKELRNANNVVVTNGNQMNFNLYGETVYYNVVNNNIHRSINNYSDTDDTALVGTLALGQTVGGVMLECDVAGCFTLYGSSPQVVDISMIFKQENTGAGLSYQGEVIIKNTFVIRNTYL